MNAAEYRMTSGYGTAALKEAFDKVANAKDWKASISGICRGEEIAVTVAAIEFYTGTVATVRMGNMNTAEILGYIPFVIESIGYRKGPCGDN